MFPAWTIIISQVICSCVRLSGGKLWWLVLNVNLPHFRILWASNEPLSWLSYWCGKTHQIWETFSPNNPDKEGYRWRKIFNFCSHYPTSIFRLPLWTAASCILGNFHSRGLFTSGSYEAHSLVNWATQPLRCKKLLLLFQIYCVN